MPTTFDKKTCEILDKMLEEERQKQRMKQLGFTFNRENSDGRACK